ncbi:MAG: hypothetical protein CM1200mP41_30880 [Gammaproteobacteria bacterium]|nr:MAG: hypothetical protein CM1200mP41_30880 [Gammaproteobacteria bacterium]
MKTHARVVVIGGGALGAGLLYFLTKEGWDDVVLVEKGELTSGFNLARCGIGSPFHWWTQHGQVAPRGVRVVQELGTGGQARQRVGMAVVRFDWP